MSSPAALAILVALPAAAADSPGADRPAFALTGARVIVSPGHVVDPGVVVVRGGVIEAVGPAGSTRDSRRRARLRRPRQGRPRGVRRSVRLDGPPGGEGSAATARRRGGGAGTLAALAHSGIPRPVRPRAPRARTLDASSSRTTSPTATGDSASPSSPRSRRRACCAAAARSSASPTARSRDASSTRRTVSTCRSSRTATRTDYPVLEDGRRRRRAPGVPRRGLVAGRRGGLRGAAVRPGAVRATTRRSRRSFRPPRARRSSSSRPTTCSPSCARSASRRR